MSDRLLTRRQAEALVPTTDCSGRKYTDEEREDIIRYILLAAELQRELTLKEVGEALQHSWLSETSNHRLISLATIEILKQGEMSR